ncbi:energy transducer TonB, partial [Lacihabitans soyangensis]
DMKFNYKNKEGLTMVVLSYEQKKDLTTLYVSEKEFETPKAPFGFSFKTIDDIPKVIVFPADSIVKVTACSQTVYSVDDFLVKEKFGEIAKPTTNPTFTGGLDELKKYFVANPLTDAKATQMMFRVSIAFLVTCDGKAGNFVIVTKGKGDLATYANQVLAIVNRMPQKWQPATVDGKAIDCYQVLSFTATTGQLDKVSYR